MNDHIEGSNSRSVGEICVAFDQAWQSGNRPPIVTYLEGFDGPERLELLRELLVLDVDYRHRLGEEVNQTDYETELPEVTTLFSAVIQDLTNGETRLENPHQQGDFQNIAKTTDASAGASIERSAGRFKILKHHAAGGLGDVFIAKDGELNREVALKEIKPQFAHDETSRNRFVVEAEITGRLEHPGIVPVYGLGKYDDGKPYYAMRFIKGESLRDAIRTFHKERKKFGQATLELRKLLHRFIDVCNAVEYAHSRGVIHRDLKPENVMLGKFGEALVVDWGLAKQVGKKSKTQMPMPEGTLRVTRISDSTAETQHGDVVGTAQYMSPEQAAGQLDELGPSSDVYSLGAVLFCILTEIPPFEESKVKGLQELLKSVRKGSFQKPSEIDSSAPKALEAICLKAMQTDPEERYESAKLLADDVERYLADEPVKSFREPIIFRTARWGRKHKVTVSGVVVLLVTSVITLSASTFFVNEERKQTKMALDDLQLAHLETQRHQKELQRQQIIIKQALAETEKQKGLFKVQKERAQEESRKAIKVKEVLLGMFEAADPLGLSQFGFRLQRGFGEQLTAATLLKKTAKKVTTELADDKILLAELQNTIGQVYRSLGMYPQAEQLLESAYKIRLNNRANKLNAKSNKLDLADSLFNLGWLHHDLGEYSKAENAYRETLKIRKEELNETDSQITDVLFSLGWLYSEMRRHEEAEKLLSEGLSLCNKRSPKATLEKMKFLYALSGSKIMQGKHLEASVVLNRATLDLEELKEESPLFEAIEYAQQGFIALNFLHDSGTSIRHYKKAETLGISILGEDHVYMAVLFYEIAQSHEKSGDLGSAEGYYRRSLKIIRDQKIMTHPHVSTFIVTFARFLVNTGRKEEGFALVQEYLQAIEATGNELPHTSVQGLTSVARFYKTNRHLKESIDVTRKLLGVYAAGSWRNSLDHATAMNSLAHTLMNSGSKSPEIETLLRDSLKIREDEKQVDSRGYTAALTNLSRLLIERNEFTDEVESSLLRIFEIDRKNNSGMFSFLLKKEIDYDFSHTLELLNRFYIGRKNVEKAVYYINQRRKLFPKNATILYHLGCEYSAIVGLLRKKENPTVEDRNNARKYAAQAIEALQESYKEGFLNRRLWKTDKDLDPVRNEEGFKKLIVKIEADYRARRKKKSTGETKVSGTNGTAVF